MPGTREPILAEEEEMRDAEGNSEIINADRPLIATPTGREDEDGLVDEGAGLPDDAWAMDVSARPVGEVTGAGDPGGAGDHDGLDDLEEEVRAYAEDRPTGFTDD